MLEGKLQIAFDQNNHSNQSVYPRLNKANGSKL